jgi:ceramide glucosyltransferase
MRALLVLQIVSAAGSICGIGFYLLCIWSARDYLGHKRKFARVTGADGAFAPAVSILKPLRGTDPQMYESFRSHCVQDYSEYELIFGVSEADDPVVPLVERLQKEFPNQSIRLLVCSQQLGMNVKVSNLVQMLPLARHGYVLINDSDIRVPRDYLRRVMANFGDSGVGLVTCLYRGIAGGTLGSRLESVGISTEFMPGVLAARQIERGVHFGLGSTLAMRREALQAVGGFEPLLDYLADDYELGYRVSGAGFRVALSDVVVDTFLPDYSLRGFFNHQLRWGRSTRDSRKWSYFGLLLTFGWAWSILAVIASQGARWAWGLFATALLLRLLMALVVGWEVLGDRQVLRDWWLVPLRELVAVAVWIGSYTGHTITWRGRKFVLRDKKLHPQR